MNNYAALDRIVILYRDAELNLYGIPHGMKQHQSPHDIEIGYTKRFGFQCHPPSWIWLEHCGWYAHNDPDIIKSFLEKYSDYVPQYHFEFCYLPQYNFGNYYNDIDMRTQEEKERDKAMFINRNNRYGKYK